MTRVVAIVQARMGSTRLPGKVLRDMAGKPLVDRVLDRLTLAKRVDATVVATSDKPADDALERHLRARGVPVVRGPEDDVLSRFAMAANQYPADVYVRVTADSALLSPRLIDDAVEAVLSGADYATYALEPRTYPMGLGGEAFTAAALAAADQEDKDPAWREHVTPFLYRTAGRFRVRNLQNPVNLSHHRWTVDTPEDYELCRRVWMHFSDRPFDFPDVVALLERHPDWVALNAHVEQRKVPPKA